MSTCPPNGLKIGDVLEVEYVVPEFLERKSFTSSFEARVGSIHRINKNLSSVHFEPPNEDDFLFYEMNEWKFYGTTPHKIISITVK